MTAIQEFSEAVRRSGLNPPDTIEADGNLHRFASNGKKSDDSGWYVLHDDGIPAGAFGDWRSGVNQTWRAEIGRKLTPAETAEHRARIEAARRAAQIERERMRAEAAKRAAQIWQAASPAPEDHPYLRAKGIQAHGARLHDDALVIPMHDATDFLHSLQFIGPDGNKRFLTGGRVTGCYYSIGKPNGALCIAEGFATAASVHEATGHAVTVAFNAGNLLPVAKALRQKLPEARLILCADDDAGTPGNPGLTKARDAAQAVGGLLAVPDFGVNRPEGVTDFNDLHRVRGLDAVRSIIAATVSKSMSSDHQEQVADTWPPPLDLAALATREPQPPQFILPDWLPCGYATLLAGHGGVGKSAIALHLAACIATGGTFAGMVCEPRRVLYLSCEDREGVLHWRLDRICGQMGISMAELVGRLDIVELVGHDSILWERDPQTGNCYTPAYGQLAERARASQIEVLMVDGISDTYAGNENSRGEVKRFVNALLALVPADTGAVILIGHVAKPTAANALTTEGYSGSTGWHNAVRARWYLYPETQRSDDSDRPERTGALLFELQKTNHGRPDQSMTWRWNDEAHMFLPDAPASHFDRTLQQREEQRGILLALRDCAQSGIAVPAAATGPRTAFHVLVAQPALPDSMRSGKPAVRRFWREIEALRAMEYVREESIRRNSDRHYVLTLALTDSGVRACGQ